MLLDVLRFRTRRLCFVPAMVLLMGSVSACAPWPSSSGTNAPSTECIVTMYARTDASPSELKILVARLRRDPQVAAVTVVSRTAAFAEMRKRFPTLVQSLKSNPLGDHVNVRLVPGIAPRAFAQRYSSANLPSVLSVKAAPSSGLSC
jgi:cell division protein FtsX